MTAGQQAAPTQPPPPPSSGTTYTIYRNVDHPWTGEPGWDVLMIQSESETLVVDCEQRGWQPWCFGESVRGSTRAVFIKPHRLGAGHKAQHWVDPNPWPESVV